MSFSIVDPSTITAGRGPHPAASPFDKRISEHLGVTPFEVYQVELPPGVSTEPHTHHDDQGEDVYAVIRGDGWLVIDNKHVPITARASDPNARSSVTTSDCFSEVRSPSTIRPSDPHMIRAAKTPLSVVAAALTARTKSR